MFEHVSQPLARVIGTAGRTTYGDCPACGYKQALSVTVKDGKSLYHCHGGCTKEELWRVIGGGEQQTHRPEQKTTHKPVNEFVMGLVQRLWDESIPATGSLVDVYLHSRGLRGDQ